MTENPRYAKKISAPSARMIPKLASIGPPKACIEPGSYLAYDPGHGNPDHTQFGSQGLSYRSSSWNGISCALSQPRIVAGIGLLVKITNFL